MARDEYFMRVEIATGFAKGHGRLVLVPREQGAYELKSDKVKPLDANKVANKDVVAWTCQIWGRLQLKNRRNRSRY